MTTTITPAEMDEPHADFAEGDRVRWVRTSAEDIYGTVTAAPDRLFIRGDNGTDYAIRDNWELARRAIRCTPKCGITGTWDCRPDYEGSENCPTC